MKKLLAASFLLFCLLHLRAQQPAEVYVDKNGVMRRSDTRQEVSFFGVNYTLPFAHAYRAAGYLGVDRKQAIDQDVYHFARLGFNAYRIHIWDVEISDSTGNLMANDHLDLLDYLIFKLKERGIHVLITAQTNFGNGYPERNQPTGGFTYLYDKCDIHANPRALAAQERYLGQLVQHKNKYTGKAYKDEPGIVGFEINNEPCHANGKAQTRDYINAMLAALKKAGNRKPVFYNVSHNGYVAEAYFETAIHGTTYQWYPTGLVSGHTRRGNFLPHVDSYPIPFSGMKGFSNKAKLVYEFDPADLLVSYVYPAAVRSFRTAGFQWITQFAYDPLFMAGFNTEYQTHFLNLAYTPGKALSMKIAAEAARELPRGKSYGTYPADTVFGNFRVSARLDRSELNSPTRFFYSNSTQTQPVDAAKLESVAGVGCSPVVDWEGTGAYFADKLESGTWRLEVMPDAVPVSDPFAKPSPEKEVVRIYHQPWIMTLALPDLGRSFRITGLDAGNRFQSETTDGSIRTLRPGVYLLQKNDRQPKTTWQTGSRLNTIGLGEFVAPTASDKLTVYHQPAPVAPNSRPLKIEALVAAPQQPDSVLLYTNRISFWNDHNPYVKLTRTTGYRYQTEVVPGDLHGTEFRYTLVVYRGGKATTFPSGVEKSPLDWDYTAGEYYTTALHRSGSPLVLFDPAKDNDLETYVLPEWSAIHRELTDNGPTQKPSLTVRFRSDDDHPGFYLRRYIGEQVARLQPELAEARYLCIQTRQTPAGLTAGFVDHNGATWEARCPEPTDGIVRLPLSQLKQAPTVLLPVAYPVFMPQHFTFADAQPFNLKQLENLVIWMEGKPGQPCEIGLGTIWME